jgi:hypothetical protein
MREQTFTTKFITMSERHIGWDRYSDLSVHIRSIVRTVSTAAIRRTPYQLVVKVCSRCTMLVVCRMSVAAR